MKPAVLLLLTPIVWAQPDAAAKSRRAGELVVAGKAEEAIPLYQELARAFPNDGGILLNLSIAEFKSKRYRDAATHAAGALKLQPDSIAANLFLGSSYEELGEHSQALGPLEKVLALRPQERNARLMLAGALLNIERYEEAEAEFQKAAEVAPENPRVWYGLGRTLEALSENVFQRMESAHAASPYWHALAGDLSLKKRRYGSAFTHYRQALEDHAAPPGVHAGLAMVYRRTGHAAWAEIEEERERLAAPGCGAEGLACDFANRRFREIVQSNGAAKTPEALYWTFKTYVEMAHEAYGHLSQLPESFEAHVYRATALDLEGLAREAAAEWREALRLNPRDARTETALAWSLFRAHEFEAALPVLKEVLQKARDSRELNFLFGAILENLDQPEKAIAPLEAAIRLDGNFGPAHAALGQALLKSGKPELAIAHLKAALAGDEDGSAHFGLLRAYQLTGQTELAARAKVEYQQALKLADEKTRLEEGAAITAP